MYLYRSGGRIWGSGENMIGLPRRFFSKGTDFLKVTESELADEVNMLNHRPKK
jgi:IS30 family transposase